jgi:hypothetical protein
LAGLALASTWKGGEQREGSKREWTERPTEFFEPSLTTNTELTTNTDLARTVDRVDHGERCQFEEIEWGHEGTDPGSEMDRGRREHECLVATSCRREAAGFSA